MKSQPTASQLQQILHDSGLPVANKKLSLQELPRNHERQDYAKRRNYVLYAGPDIIGFLTAGSNLRQLADRTGLFHRAYPGLGVRVLGYTKLPEGEILLQEHFDGQPAHRLLAKPGGTDRIRAFIERISRVFGDAEAPSDPGAAQAELNAIFTGIAELSHWTSVDLAFLREVVKPYLETHLLTSGKPTRRITNGDFLLRNLLVSDSGQFRLVDCEYATDTHFHREDWLRFTYWDALPQALRVLADTRVPQRAPWTVFFCLKQLLLESRINVPQKAQADAGHWCREIRRILEHDDAITRISYFWPKIGVGTQEASTEARLYWQTDQGWSDRDSVALVLEPGRQIQLIFEVPAAAVAHGLRLDPMNGPGVITIHSLRVVLMDEVEQVIWAGEDSVSLQRLAPGGDSLFDLDPATGVLRVVALDNDPQLYLANVGKSAGKSLQVRAVVTLSDDPLDQIAPVRRYIQFLHNRRSRVADTPVITDANVVTLVGHLDSLAKTTEAGLASLTERLQSSETLEKNWAETKMALAALQITIPERERQLALAREALQGHARTIDRLEQSRDKLELALQAAQTSALAQNEVLRVSEDQGGRLAQELAAIRERLSLANETARRLEATCGALQTELTACRASLESSRLTEARGVSRGEAAQEELDRMRISLANHEQLLARLGGQLDAAKADTRALAATLAAEQNLRRDLENSRSWRWTAWMRRGSAR